MVGPSTDKSCLFDFELHYDSSAGNPRSVLEAILERLSSYKRLHDWDTKLTRLPLKTLTGAVRGFLANTTYSNANETLYSQSVAEEVFTLHGKNIRRPALDDGRNPRNLLFFSKVSP